MAAWIAAVFALVCLFRENSGSLTLVANPTFQHVGVNASVQFMCQSDVPVTACKVSLLGPENIDLEVFSSDNTGTDLDFGKCGFNLTIPQRPQTAYGYACHARDYNGQWQYTTSVSFTEGTLNPIDAAESQFIGHNFDSALTVETPPEKLIVQSGADVELSFKAAEALDDCQFKIPGEKSNSWLSNKWLTRENLTGSYSIDDSELAQGRCRLTIHNVTAEQSGFVKSHIMSKNADNKEGHFLDLTTLIVLKAPVGAPVLTLNNANAHYNSGDVMEASCHVGLARPRAWVTWILNKDLILGETEDLPKGHWVWDYEAAEVTWKLKRTLTSEHDDKEVVCRVHHDTFPEGFFDVKTKITVAGVKGQP